MFGLKLGAYPIVYPLKNVSTGLAPALLANIRLERFAKDKHTLIDFSATISDD